MTATENTKLQSSTVTNEETFTYTLEIDEDGEILSAAQITYHCSECGEEATAEEGEEAYCEEHPSATVESVVSAVELKDTPTGLGDDSDTDVVFFTPDSPTLAGSFGLQVRDGDGNLTAICDLDGETLSGNARWIIPDKVPAPVAEYAEAVCG